MKLTHEESVNSNLAVLRPELANHANAEIFSGMGVDRSKSIHTIFGILLNY